MSKKYLISSLIDTNYLKINCDSTIQFFNYKALDTFYLLNSISFQDRSDTFDIKVSDFVFNNFITTQCNLTIDEITGLPLPDTITLMPIPPFNRNINKILRINTVANGFIRSCFLNVVIVNNSRLRFDSIRCQLANYEIISFNNLESLSTVEYNQYLSNVFIDSMLNLNVLFYSAGTGSESILISRHDSIKFIVRMDSLRVEYGYLRFVPPRLIRTNKTKIYSIPANYPFRVNNLIFASGQLTIDINSFSPITTLLHCSIPELSYDTTLQVPTQSSVNLTVDLQQRCYHNNSDSLTPLTLKTDFEFLLDSVYIYFGPKNSIVVSYLINNIQIDSIAGTIIDTIHHRFSVDSVTVKLPDFLQNVQASRVLAQLNITNAIAFSINCRFLLVGISNSDSVIIDSSFSIDAGSPNVPTCEIFALDITRLFNFHPEYIRVNITLNTIGTGWISRGSFATGSYTITAPMRVVFKADTVTFSPSTVKIGKMVAEFVRDYGETSEFLARIQNHLPLRLKGGITLQNQTFDTVLVDILVPSGIVDVNTGVVIASADTTITLLLDSIATRIFTDSIIQVSLCFYLPDTDTITISASDYIKIVDSYTRVKTKPILK